jgi:hypothetical protein
MSDRERIRRPEPVRTEPVRRASGMFRGGAGAGGPDDASSGSGAGAGAAPGNPFAWPDEDPVSRAVRAGCEVVEQAVRRGFGGGRAPGPDLPWLPWAGAGTSGGTGDPLRPTASPWTTGQWVDTMTSAFTMWTQWVDGWSAAARSVMTGTASPAGSGPGAWPTTPAPASAPVPSAAGPLHVVVQLDAARAASVQLDLSPGAAGALEVHGLLAPASAAAPPITDVTVTVAEGAVTVAIGGIEHYPAGTYAGAVLAAGRACGTLTVRLT